MRKRWAHLIFSGVILAVILAYWVWYAIELGGIDGAEGRGLFQVWFGWFYGGLLTLAGLGLLLVGNLLIWGVARWRRGGPGGEP